MVDPQTEVKSELVEWARVHNEPIHPRNPGDPFQYRRHSLDEFYGARVPSHVANICRELSSGDDYLRTRGAPALAALLDEWRIPFAIVPAAAFRFPEDRDDAA